MRNNSQKSYPYPVIRESHDDFYDETFSAEPDFILSADDNIATFTLNYNLSSRTIKRQIANENATYLTVFSCRDTFFHKVFRTSEEAGNTVEINTDEIYGKLTVESFVYITEDVAIDLKNINEEYLPKDVFADKRFEYSAGSVIAQSKVWSFDFIPGLFNFNQSLFQLELDEELPNGEWLVSTDQDKIIIKAAKDIINIETRLTDHKYGESVMDNSIYFAAVMHVVQELSDTPELVDEFHWAKVVDQMKIQKGINDNEPVYRIASKLMDQPFSELENMIEAEE